MTIASPHAAQTHFSRLVDQAAAGGEIIIAKSGRPVAKLTPLTSAPREKRRLGLLAERAVIPPDFDAPLPDDVIDDFEGCCHAAHFSLDFGLGRGRNNRSPPRLRAGEMC